MPSLVLLAEQLLAQAHKIDARLGQHGRSYPSFGCDTLDELPGDTQKLRAELCDTSYTFFQLVRGAKHAGLDIAFNWTDQLVLRIIWYYELAFAVPLDGYATYEQISVACGLNRSIVTRTIRAAIPLRIFDEPIADHVCHTATSRLLVEDEGFRSCIGLQTQDVGPAGTKLIEAWECFGSDAGEPDRSAFSLAHEGKSLFTVLSQESQVAHRFNVTMKYWMGEGQLNSYDIVKAFDWHSIDYPGSRLIDLGGSYGHLSQTLAQHTLHLKFTVQDLPHVVEQGKKTLLSKPNSRISFEAWNFLEAQPSENPPSAFLISRCLHNWSDEYCTTILRALIPALQRDSRILIWDVVKDVKPVRKISERFTLQRDFIMATIANGRDRSQEEFERVLRSSDDRFKIEDVRQLKGCTLS